MPQYADGPKCTSSPARHFQKGMTNGDTEAAYTREYEYRQAKEKLRQAIQPLMNRPNIRDAVQGSMKEPDSEVAVLVAGLLGEAPPWQDYMVRLAGKILKEEAGRDYP